MRGQSIAVNNIASFLLGKKRIERINPMVAAEEFSLDGAHKADDLIGKAAHHSRIHTPVFQKKFSHHRASEYVPAFT